jgi:hypothetical protein
MPKNSISRKRNCRALLGGLGKMKKFQNKIDKKCFFPAMIFISKLFPL